MTVRAGGEAEVRRRDRLAAVTAATNAVFGHRLDGVVGGPLLADRRLGGGRQVLPAGRTGAVGREDPDAVGQGEQLLVQRVVERPGQLVGRGAHRRQQVRAADVADEEGVAGEHPPRFGVGVLVDHDGDRLGGVAGGRPGLERHLPEREVLAVRQGLDGELRPGSLAVADDGSGGGGDFEVAGEEIGVEVRFDDPLDVQACGLGVGQVLRDVALWVDDDGPAGRLVANEVAEQR